MVKKEKKNIQGILRGRSSSLVSCSKIPMTGLQSVFVFDKNSIRKQLKALQRPEHSKSVPSYFATKLIHSHTNLQCRLYTDKSPTTKSDPDVSS